MQVISDVSHRSDGTISVRSGPSTVAISDVTIRQSSFPDVEAVTLTTEQEKVLNDIASDIEKARLIPINDPKPVAYTKYVPSDSIRDRVINAANKEPLTDVAKLYKIHSQWDMLHKKYQIKKPQNFDSLSYEELLETYKIAEEQCTNLSRAKIYLKYQTFIYTAIYIAVKVMFDHDLGENFVKSQVNVMSYYEYLYDALPEPSVHNMMGDLPAPLKLCMIAGLNMLVYVIVNKLFNDSSMAQNACMTLLARPGVSPINTDDISAGGILDSVVGFFTKESDDDFDSPPK